jgi:hypothetical protein
MQKIKTFCARLLLLILLLVVLDRAGGRLLQHYYLKVTSGSEYKTIYAVEKSGEEVLVLGSSRAYHHYVSTMLEKGLRRETYNLGRDGAGILYNYAVYQTICERSKPKMVILDLNADEFIADNVSYQLLYQLLPHYDKSRYIREVVRLRSPFENVKVQSWLYRYNSQLFYIAANNIRHSDIDIQKGYLALQGRVKGQPEIPAKSNAAVDTLLLHYFERFLEAAKSNKTEVVVCLSPVYRQYPRPTSSVIQIYRICRQHNVPLLDHLQDSLFLQHPGYFRDISHLNDKGAHLYTGKLLEALKGLGY